MASRLQSAFMSFASYFWSILFKAAISRRCQLTGSRQLGQKGRSGATFQVPCSQNSLFPPPLNFLESLKSGRRLVTNKPVNFKNRSKFTCSKTDGSQTQPLVCFDRGACPCGQHPAQIRTL